MLEQLTHKLESVDVQLQHMASPQPPPPQAAVQAPAESTEEANRNYLMSMDEDKVIANYCNGRQLSSLQECN